MNLLPANVQEAFETFTEPDNDTPSDCHNHCNCYEEEGHCCDCGEDKPIQEPKPILEFLQQHAREDQVEIRGLIYDLDCI